MNKTYYYGIDMVKLICALIVVSIHTTLFLDINDKLYYIYGNYITRFAVPFFFICSGYFFAPLILHQTDVREIRNNTKKYFFRLLRPFVLWGICYFILAVSEEVVIDHHEIKDVLLKKIHLLLVESPGGGLWYVYALLWIIVFVFAFYKHNREIRFFIASFILFLIPGIWNTAGSSAGWLNLIHNAYYTVFLSERSAIFFAVYFFTGMLFFRYLKKNISLWKLLLLQLLLYLAFALLCNSEKNIFAGLLLQLCKYALAAGWFLIALNIPDKWLRQSWLRDNARKMSTIIYFTHFISIYLVKIVLMIAGLKFNDHCSAAFVFSAVILLIYSAVFINLDKQKKAVKLFY